ncbi:MULTISPECIES: phosphate signaling complex protein PhoU [unclassified Anaerobiospirillum]|uniref:phosphate signaling complex protein PhoU n=1 Tax=unclassified Anaerobiospirillum TaxID=2647410 RepID=UPI001FF445D1|nr:MULTISPECIES: phosphate signaling complex protein PhoU [unclassified Anaerobiospirillum]MCK0535577.1 phosphate signaling complex protein PhoU [Anaerobiospirillum sp. NML120511]MCK0539529.1 phosphate signaling complex protein PhoU [Anaerobiospirillum sp. NML02-A-032]
MRELYNHQLRNLCDEIESMGKLCDNALNDAIKALQQGDQELARSIYQSDFVIDQKEREIENLCLSIILHQQPIASDLRLVSASLKLITDLERIGDQASDIAEIVMNLDYTEKSNFKLIEDMAVAARAMVNDAIKAFVTQDLALANQVIERDDIVDDYLVKARDQMVSLITEQGHSPVTIVDLIMMAKYLERIGDHATNVANWVIFQQTGEHPDKNTGALGSLMQA